MPQLRGNEPILGLNMPNPWDKCCLQRLSNSVCLCIKDSSSQVESLAGSFLHLMGYSEMDLFLSWRILVSVMASGSNMIFPSSSSSDNIVWTGILSPITLFKHETWKTGCTREDAGKSNVYAIIPIFCNTL